MTASVAVRRWWADYVLAVRHRADAEAEAFRATTPRSEQRRRLAWVLGVSAASLIAIQLAKHGSDPGWLTATLGAVGADGLAADLENAMLRSENQRFNQLLWWSIVQVGGYLVLPLLTARLVLGDRVGDYGVGRPPTRGAGIYVLAYFAFVPVVVLASFTQPFQERYPFYDLAVGESIWPYLAGWWVLYALQFAALEWFFRGFMVGALKPVLGYLAVPLMVVPYFLIHLQKPALEAAGAIVAGMALGTLALKTRTIWWGAVLHVAVALTMDVASLVHKDLLW